MLRNVCSFCGKKGKRLLIHSPINPSKSICIDCTVSAKTVLKESTPIKEPRIKHITLKNKGGGE